MKVYGVISLLVTLVLPSAVVAQSTLDNQSSQRAQSIRLEQGLLNSMSIFIDNEGIIQRNESSGQAIQAYMKQNYVNKKPNVRFDYTDYYFLKKPASLLGHELKVIEEEYMAEYIGCCVSPGVGAVIRQRGSLDELKDFAIKNKCSLEPIDFDEYLKNINVKYPKALHKNYYSISCRERELNKEE